MYYDKKMLLDNLKLNKPLEFWLSKLHASHQAMLPVMLSFFVVFLSHHKNFHLRPPEEVRNSMKLKHCDKNSVFNVVSILSMQHTVSLNDSQSLF